MIALITRVRTPVAKETMVSPSPEAPVPFTRRSLLAGVGGAVAATALSACAGASGTSELTLYQSKPEAIPYFSRLAADFTESQGRFAVQHDIATNLSASFVRNSPPDLGCLNYNLEMGRFMERGALSDLSDLGTPPMETFRIFRILFAPFSDPYDLSDFIQPRPNTG